MRGRGVNPAAPQDSGVKSSEVRDTTRNKQAQICRASLAESLARLAQGDGSG